MRFLRRRPCGEIVTSCRFSRFGPTHQRWRSQSNFARHFLSTSPSLGPEHRSAPANDQRHALFAHFWMKRSPHREKSDPRVIYCTLRQLIRVDCQRGGQQPIPAKLCMSISKRRAEPMRFDGAMTTSTRSDGHDRIASFINTIADESCSKKLTGIAIGAIVDGQEFSVFSGWADVESKKPVSESTVFEIGSLSKLFTSLLLAVSTTKQEVSLDDPVQTALGERVTLPTDGRSQITYRSLANHRSSLPRLPDDLIATADLENPYVHYDQEMLYACFNRMESLKPIGSRSSYSNLGVGLLGHVLGKLAGSDYRTALQERVLIPLGMLNTSTEASDEQAAQLATAQKKKNKPTKHWDFTEVTAAAGGVRSSLADMVKFLRTNVDPKRSELADALAIMREPSTFPECKYRSSSVPAWWPCFYSS